MEEINMSENELERYSLLNQVVAKHLSQVEAARLLKLSDRQVRNLLKAFKDKGTQGIVSKKRGRTSNRALCPTFRKQVMALIQERYSDFGPSFANEKLAEYHNITLSNETLRKWMIEDNLWTPRQKSQCIHPLRSRREFFGELIQIDASHHHWFEDRAEKCALIVFVDDATGKITSLFFCEQECIEGYFIALRKHIIKYGRPLGLYSDRHAIFGGSEKIHNAQFVRALKELDIERILAYSPQAKGRVERVNKTLQDRLIKEMRLRNICSIEEGNRYLPEFIDDFNKKFSKEPRDQYDAHRPLDSGYDLERILTRCETRTLAKDLSISFNNRIYQILELKQANRLKGKKVEIRHKSDGTFRVFYNGMELRYMPIEEFIEQRELNTKEKLVWKPKKEWHQSKEHPWKKYWYQWTLSEEIKLKEKAMV